MSLHHLFRQHVQNVVFRKHVVQIDKRHAEFFGKSTCRLDLSGQFHLHDGVTVRQASGIGEVFNLRDLTSFNNLRSNQILQAGPRLVPGIRPGLAPEALVIFAFGIRVRQAQHRSSEFIQEILGRLQILAGRILTYDPIQLLVVGFNF